MQNAAVLASRTIVRATFAGVVAKRTHNPGDMVEAGASDVDPAGHRSVAASGRRIRGDSDLARVQTGKPAHIFVPGSDEPESGKVLTRPAAVDPAGVSADVRIAFEGVTKLAAGTPVRIEIVAEQRKDVIVVPVEAVLTEDEEIVRHGGGRRQGAEAKSHARSEDAEAGRDRRPD